MHNTIITFLQLSLYPAAGFIGTGGILATATTIDDDAAITLGLLLTVVAILVTVGIAISVGLWKLATILSTLKAETTAATEDRPKLADQLTELKECFAIFSANCPAQSKRCTPAPFPK